MKQILFFFTFLSLLSCENTKVMSSDSAKEIEVANNSSQPDSNTQPDSVQPKDSIIQQLQKENDLLIAFEVATVAWGKTSSYKILAKKGNDWKGYTAFISHTPKGNSSLAQLEIDDAAAEEVWQFFNEQKIENLPGDNGENFCTDNSKNCNINDGTIWHLLIITKDKISDVSYYEPEFYEKCCPGNQERKLFLEAVNKLSSVIGDMEEER